MGSIMQNSIHNYTPPSLSKPLQPLALSPAGPSLDFYSSHFIPATFQVPCYSFTTQNVVPPEVLSSRISPKPSSLTLLTYNIWFQSHNDEYRYPTILKILSDSGADIICLQQVNQHFLTTLHSHAKKSPKLRQYYLSSIKMHWYDTVILSRYPCRFYKRQFQTSLMGRCMLTAVLELEYELKKIKIAVNCVHLQSLNNEAERINQLKVIGEINKEMDICVIAGDFNFSDGCPENQTIAGYTDIWKEGKRHFSQFASKEMKESGFTMPSTGRFPAWRPDHVIYRSALEKGEDEIEIIGDFTVPPYEKDTFDMIAKDGQVRTPSDHFGLMAKIQL